MERGLGTLHEEPTLDNAPELTPQEALDPDDIIEELKRRGIDYWGLSPEERLATLSDTDYSRLRERLLRKRAQYFDPRNACWYPIQEDERLKEIAQELEQSNSRWRKPRQT